MKHSGGPLRFGTRAEPLAAEVFAALPAEYRRPRRTAWGDVNAGGRALDSFLEGPAFDRQGSLYLVDIPFGRIFRVDAGGRWAVVAEYDGWPNGIAIHRDGRLFVADHALGILVLDPGRDAPRPLVRAWGAEPFKGVNDLHFASDGRLYFSDQGQTGLHDPTGRIFRLDEGGAPECLLATGPSPNGLCLDPSERQLYVAMTRANAVWRIPLLPDGSASKVGLYIQMSGGLAGPDGLALDCEGGLVVAHPGTTAWRYDARGSATHFLAASRELFITNVAFAGATLYAVDALRGEVLRAQAPFEGKPLYSHAP